MPNKKLDKAQLAQFKKDQAKLYKAGLVTKPAKLQKPTRHALANHKKFRNFLNGRDQVVTVPRGKAKEYAQGDKYKTHGNKVLVPKQAGGRARYDKKLDTITRTRTLGGVTTRQQLKPRTLDELRALEGPGVTFAIPINAHHGYNWLREKTIDELQEHFSPGKSLSNFKDWVSYIVVETNARDRRRNRSDEGEA